jgi:probable H4MPT-linked C1 transfer pathway protein
MSSIGWDIGGVNVKVAHVAGDRIVRAMTEPFSIEHDADELSAALARLGRDAGAPGCSHAVTMTAELSQRFRSKAEGVGFVLDALEQAFPAVPMHVLDTSGRFRSPAEARARPIEVSASNWVATATVVASEHADVLLIDMGSTTTDIIPIESGQVQAVGRTDPDRLASGELVYSGALRTPVEALVHEVPWRGGMALVSADDFAHTRDVHLWLGTLPPTALADAPDGQRARDHAAERLARVVCADRSMLDDDAITAIARHVADAQVAAVADAITRVRARHPRLVRATVLGLGAPIATVAARVAGLDIIPRDSHWSEEASRAAPAVAVARLLERLHA